VLLKQAVLAGIRDGCIHLAFRRWAKPTVKAGTELHTGIGLVGITAVETTSLAGITTAAARDAGYASRAALLAELGQRDGTLYRIQMTYFGADPRLALRSTDKLSAAELADLLARLARLDRSAPWTEAYPELVAAHPARRGADLAVLVGLETLAFKTRMRKLKALGLTESLETGYRLAPRGKPALPALTKAGPRSK
jgi:hypothetical protein